MGGHHQAMVTFVCAWRDRVGVGVSVRPQMAALQSFDRSLGMCMGPRMKMNTIQRKGRSFITAFSLADLGLDLLYVAWMNDHFLIAGGRLGNKQTHRPIV